MNGEVGILNVGAGDTKLSFDKSNPAECMRAARIVKDMLRRGYALLVEVERDGVKAFQRALEFDETKCEYIIADFDPVEAEKVYAEDGENHETDIETRTASDGEDSGEEGRQNPKQNRQSKRRSIEASKTRAVAVARSAGG